MKMSMPDRFWRHATPEPNTGCWLWTRSVRPNGYGQFARRTGVIVHAHRMAYELSRGPIPAGMYVCHSCDVPSCVNPDHLFLGTPQDNVDDMMDKGRWTHYATRKTHCKHGHAFTSENTDVNARGQRHCRKCNSHRFRQRAA